MPDDEKPVDLPDMFRSMAKQANEQGFSGIAHLFAEQSTKDFTPYLPKMTPEECKQFLQEAEDLLKQAREKLLKARVAPQLADETEKLQLKVHYEVKRAAAQNGPNNAAK